jgi:hypothetical protein
MKKYTTKIKVVEATACKKSEAESLFGAKLSGEQEGYLVKEANSPVIEFVPRAKFEQEYELADSAVDRMTIEMRDLANKYDKLLAFFQTKKWAGLNDITKALLAVQADSMKDYYNMVARRMYQMVQDGLGTEKYPVVPGKFDFGVALRFLKCGITVRRVEWEKNNIHRVVIKQTPAVVGSDVIPKMTSLPPAAKQLAMINAGAIRYVYQCLLYDLTTGEANNYIPSAEDLFADDWEVCL